jgi:DNA repair protein RadD
VITLRPYQDGAVAKAGALVRRGVRRILIQLPTGGGKTVIAARVLSGAVAKGKRALFLAHRREIVAQSYWKLVDDGVPQASMGIVMGDGIIADRASSKPFKASNPGALAQVASVQTLVRRARPPADVVFVDECHHAAADSWQELIGHYYARGAVVIGLSATPVRTDGRGLADLFDEMVCVERVSALIEGGYLVRPRTFSSRLAPDLSGVKVRGGDYVVDGLSKAMRDTKLIGNILEHWQRHNDGRTTVVFAVDVAHSLALVERFVAAGVSAEHLDGEMDTAARDAVLGRMASGATQVVVNCMVLTEGWDLPRAKCCVLARPTKSLALHLQQVGRVMRPWQGVEAVILDHAGNCQTHGLAERDRVWELSPTVEKKGAKKPAEERQCPECGLMQHVAIRVCGHCGATLVEERSTEETSDELVEITEASLNAEETLAGELRRRVGSQVGRVVRAAREDRPDASTDDLFTAANRIVYFKLGGSRKKASSQRLEEVLAWLRGGGFEELRAQLLAGLPQAPSRPAQHATTDDNSDPWGLAARADAAGASRGGIEPAREQPRQLGFAGIAPAQPARERPRPAPQATKAAPPTTRVAPRAIAAIDRVLSHSQSLAQQTGTTTDDDFDMAGLE